MTETVETFEYAALADEQLYLPEPGDVVQHYKGDFYTVIAVARREAISDELFVVYKSHVRRIVWLRPLGEFVEIVEWPNGRYLPRFRRNNARAEDYERGPSGVRVDCGGP
jgi:hypothetical protein